MLMLKRCYEQIPVGSEGAISNSRLAERLGVDERTVRSAINKLRTKHGKPIVSSQEGYFIPRKDNPVDEHEAMMFYLREFAHAKSRLSTIKPVKKFLEVDEKQVSFGTVEK